MTTFDLTQTIFIFSTAANRASPVQGSAAELQEFLSLALQDGGAWSGIIGGKEVSDVSVTGLLASIGANLIGGDWRIAWGPAVFQHGVNRGDREADNAMFVAYSPSQDTYVVAIAATNPLSTYDWKWEDGDVVSTNMVNFPIDLTEPVAQQFTDASSSAQVTGGTALGVSILATMRDPTLGSTLTTYLSGRAPSANTKLVFTGHSLAGALSPVLALQLLPGLQAAGWKNVFVLPTAGATPGNQAFVSQFTSQFASIPVSHLPGGGNLNPGNNVTALNVLYWNTLDLVPHAWTQLDSYFKQTSFDTATSKLGQVRGTLTCGALQLAFGSASKRASGSGLAPLVNVPFDGQWPVTYWDGQTMKWGSYTPNLPYEGVGAFLTAAGHAHVHMYLPAFGLDPTVLPPALQSTSTGNLNQAVITIIEELFGFSKLASTQDSRVPAPVA